MTTPAARLATPTAILPGKSAREKVAKNGFRDREAARCPRGVDCAISRAYGHDAGLANILRARDVRETGERGGTRETRRIPEIPSPRGWVKQRMTRPAQKEIINIGIIGRD